MQSRSETTIKTSGMHKYMLTVAKHQVKDYVTKSELDNVIHCLKLKLPFLVTSTIKCYELSPKYHQLHMHIYVASPRPIFYKNNNSVNGFRLQWSKCTNYSGMIEYIRKDAINKYVQDQILIQNYFYNNYGFQ